MKTTVEISDELLKQTQRVARSEGSTLRALLEEGLRLALKTRNKKVRTRFELPTFGTGGLKTEVRNANWSSIRDRIYGEQD